MEDLILIIDQGTTNSKAVLFSPQLSAVRYFSLHVPTIRSPDGWLEQSPKEILKAARTVCRAAINSIRPGERITSMGVTNQRETTIMWNRATGTPYGNAILWEDRRTDDICNNIGKAEVDIIKKRTGLTPDPYFSASKIIWMLNNDGKLSADLLSGNVLFGTVDSWILWNFTEGRVHATDHTNASRTMLFNIDQLDWDGDILDMLGIPDSILPEAMESCADYGEISDRMFGQKIPVAAVIGDQQASLLGHGLIGKGDTKVTYGTGAFAVSNTGNERRHSERLMETLALTGRCGRSYALEGAVFEAGTLLEWVRRSLGIGKMAYRSLDPSRPCLLQRPLMFLPPVHKKGVPTPGEDTESILVGLGPGINRISILESAMASIAFRIGEILQDFEAAGILLREISADGGISENLKFLQLQSDISGKDIVTTHEAGLVTARGCAAVASGTVFDISFMHELHEADDIKLMPHMDRHTARELISRWESWTKQAGQI